MQIKERTQSLVVTKPTRPKNKRRQASIRFVSQESTSKIDLPTEKGKLEIVTEIPKAHRDSPLMSHELWGIITEILDDAQRDGVVPFESILKITPKNYPEFREAYKNPAVTVWSAIRKAIRHRKLGGVIEVVVRGDELYVQAAEDALQ